MYELAVIVAVIIGLSEIIKGYIPKKYTPLIALALGIISGVIFVDGTIQERIFVGIALGLASCGLFDISQIGKK